MVFKKDRIVQYLVFLYFIIPTFQQFGFLFIQIKIAAFTSILVLILSTRNILLYKFKRVELLTIVFFLLFFMLNMFVHFLKGILLSDLYLYIKFFAGLIIYILILYSKEVIQRKIWYVLIFINIIVAILQYIPISRDFTMFLYGSIQGNNSSGAYIRASGLVSHLYIYTQIVIMMYLILKIEAKQTMPYSLFVFFGSLLANSRSTFLLPFYYLFMDTKFINKILITICSLLLIMYLVENYVPIKAVFHHLYLAYENSNLIPILLSKNASFSHRVEDFFHFFHLYDSFPFDLTFFGLGTEIARGQEIGWFYIFTQVGIIAGILFYIAPILLAYIKLKFRVFIKYFFMVIPIIAVDFLVTGFVKYDLYILYWVFTAFYIKCNKENKS
jgi:hypothetical protein